MKENAVIFATGNEGKLREIRMILGEAGFQVYSMKEAGVETDIIEDGSTFEENALIKARAVMEATGKAAMADDSGLVIDFLNGEPGIYSARYMGEDTSYEVKNRALLERLKDVPEQQRTARFVCVIAYVSPAGEEITCEGTMEGRIAETIAGEHGFGYDPIFFLPEYGCTSAQLAPEQKNAISHRGKALRMMREKLSLTAE